MSFNILYNDNLSLRELIKINNENGSIIRSSHIGNWNKSTMALSKLNFHIIMHEFLKGNAFMYEPAFIKTENKKIPISKNSEIYQLYDNTFNFGDRNYYKPTKFHFDNIISIFKNVESISSYFLENESILNIVIDTLIDNYSKEFDKYIDSNGNVYTLTSFDNLYNCYSYCQNTIKLSKNDVKEAFRKLLIETRNCLNNNTNKNPSGILPNTKIYLLLTCVIELLIRNVQFESAELYHFSGLQMINYLIKNKKNAEEYNVFLNDAYELIRKEMTNLPKNVNFNLIPTEFVKYVSCRTSCNCNIIDDIYEIYKRIIILKKERKEIIRENILSIQDGLKKKSITELLQIVISLKNRINKRRFKKLLIFAKENMIKELINELVNILVIKDKSNETIEYYNKCIEEYEKNIILLISENQEIFDDSITQNDLIKNNEDIYVSNSALDLKINEILQITCYKKAINEVKNIKKNILRNN